jgi:hypothetical protein
LSLLASISMTSNTIITNITFIAVKFNTFIYILNII